MTDLVKRLRYQGALGQMYANPELQIEASDRIEQLEAALRSIAANSCCDTCQEAALVSRVALGEKKDV